MSDLKEPSLNTLRSMLHSGYVETCTLGLGSNSICDALTKLGYATKRIAVFSENADIQPAGTVHEPQKGMITRQVLEITAAGRKRATESN